MPDTKEPKKDEQPKAEKTEKPEKVAWHFTGGHLADGRPAQFLRGIPARDLTKTDIDALTADQRKRALGSGLYRDAEKAS